MVWLTRPCWLRGSGTPVGRASLLNRDLQSLEKGELDVLVIGGGITGACIAHDAALRGMRVALVEKRDFGWFTSSASSKLLHGGIRYLPHGQFGKVRESARERNIFQTIAPHLTSYLPFIVPVFQGSFLKGPLAMRAAMGLYRVICAGLAQSDDPAKQIPPSRFLDRRELLNLVPTAASLPGVIGGQVLHESHMWSSERMTLAFVKSAAAHGAVVANYLEMRSLITEEHRVRGILAADRLSGREFVVRARMTVNAAGPDIPGLNALQPGLRLAKQTTGFSKGVHLVTRQLTGGFALALPTAKKTEGMVTRGGRHLFILPWRGRSLIGTTNVPFNGRPDEVRATHQDVVDFLADINEALPGARLSLADVFHAFAGLYPLTAREIQPDTYQGTGEYQIIDHERDGIFGMLTALGAKYTTARRVAEKVTDLLHRKLGGGYPPCATATTRLTGGEIGDWRRFVQLKSADYRAVVNPAHLAALLSDYGSEIDEVLAALPIAPAAGEAGEKDILRAVVDQAVLREMACTLADLIFRRTGLGTIGHPGRETVAGIAQRMAELLGWDAEKVTAEIAAVDGAYRCLRP